LPAIALPVLWSALVVVGAEPWQQSVSPLKRFPAKRVVPLICGKSIVSGGVWGG